MSSAGGIVRIAALQKPATHSLIFLHGLGDSGAGWKFLGTQLQRVFPRVNFVFPTAPIVPITANGGYPMNAWFDLKEWDPQMRQFDNEGYLSTLTQLVPQYVQEEVHDGVSPENIVLGGFSQGAAIALGAAVTLPCKIGGFVSLSGFVSCNEKLLSKHIAGLNVATPIFHGHGDSDPVVALSRGRRSQEWLVEHYGFSKFEFHHYSGLEHSLGEQELQDLVQFLRTVWKQ